MHSIRVTYSEATELSDLLRRTTSGIRFTVSNLEADTDTLPVDHHLSYTTSITQPTGHEQTKPSLFMEKDDDIII